MKKRKKTNKNDNKSDQCQTPHYAIDPLLPYLKQNWIIWESACGKGQLVHKLTLENFKVVSTDILTGHDFFKWQPQEWDCQVTNPPYSIKYNWLEWSYRLDKPFTLLLPVTTIGAATAQNLFKTYGIEIILLDKRINFNMPNKGYRGGGSHFSVAWFTYGLHIGCGLTFATVKRYEDQQLQFPLPKNVNHTLPNPTVNHKQQTLF